MVGHEQRLGIDLSTDQLLMMSKLVKRAVENSLKAFNERNILLARNVIESDKPINSYEIDIDNSTYGLLSFSRIPSEMLRRIIAIQKINAMLERIGDHAVNIAESTLSLAVLDKSADLFSLPDMGKACMELLDGALRSFFDKDPNLAQEVCGRDDEVDRLNRELISTVKEKVLARELQFEPALDLIRISRNLERIADLSTNIAEEAVFAAIGRVIKHNEDENRTH